MRLVIEEPCEHGSYEVHESGSATGNTSSGFRLPNCPGGSRRVLTEGEYVLIEKVDGEWPEWALDAANPFDIVVMGDGYKSLASRESSDILDALAGGGS